MNDIERYSPNLAGRIAYEHLHRYAVAKDYVVGADVLDIACGEGYGSSILASVARHVTGLDNDVKSVTNANVRYGRADELDYISGDAAEIPAQDGAFDVVVSFETIEHLRDAARFVAEIRRVLKPNGLLIISSPNEPEYKQSLSAPNPFHFREFDAASFDEILAENFAHREMFGQRMAIASSLAPMSQVRLSDQTVYRAYTGVLGNHLDVTAVHSRVARLGSPEYLLCFCSDVAIVHPGALDSIFVLPEDDLWLDHRRVMAWASNLHDETSVLNEQLCDLRGKLEVAEQNNVASQDSTDMAEGVLRSTNLEREVIARAFDTRNNMINECVKILEASILREGRVRPSLKTSIK